MSDGITQQTTPESVAPPSATPEVVATPAPVPAPVGSPQQQSREEIYNKYYGAPAEPVAAPTPAPVDPAPAVVAPVTIPPPAPIAPAVDPAYIQQLVTEAVRTLMPQAPKPTPPPVAPPAAPTDPNAWIQALIAGDFDGATKSIKEQLMREVQTSLAPELARTTLNEATENFKAETELNTFVNSIREGDPDIVKLEPLLAPKIQLQMAEWVNSQGGTFRPLAYVEQYKKVAMAEISEARNLVQSFRAAGATGQQTVKQEVLSASTLAPSPVQAPQMPAGQPQAQDAKSYMEMRQQQTLMRNGMKMRN